MRRGTSALVLLAAAGCGYTPVASPGPADGPRCAVALRASHVPDAVVADEVVAGVRDALADASLLGDRRSTHRCEVDVLRVDEASDGIAATPGPDGTLSPASRATRVGVVGRAVRMRRGDADAERDTGDLRVFETISVAENARDATFRHMDAQRAAARRLGRSLGSYLAGRPLPSED